MVYCTRPYARVKLGAIGGSNVIQEYTKSSERERVRDRQIDRAV